MSTVVVVGPSANKVRKRAASSLSLLRRSPKSVVSVNMSVAESDDDDAFYDTSAAAAADASYTATPPYASSEPQFDREQLEKCGTWLSSIPRDDVIALKDTPEYSEFLKAFEKLGHAHRRVLALEGDADTEWNNNDSTSSRHSDYSFLQHKTVDDVVLRVFEFLECQSLIRTCETCVRFWDLAHRSATQRTLNVAQSRTLHNNAMKLLRAKEHMDGSSWCASSGGHVPVPILGLPKRILVTDAGDEEYNGIYYCTSCDGNGFVFTKPRNAVSRRGVLTAAPPAVEPVVVDDDDDEEDEDEDAPDIPLSDDETSYSGNAHETAQPGQLLRCIIAKRFSNETILWYMSKEVETVSTTVGTRVSQVFSFWAKLMVIGEASSAQCRYPSQTSVLSVDEEEAWQCLSGTRLTHPPTVELME